VSEHRVTVELRFHADLPEDLDEGERVSDQISEAIIETLRERYADYLAPGLVAAESFEIHAWDDEALE
jgi:hypothetical protein